MWNPLSWVMEVAVLMAIILACVGGRPLNWHEFVGIICLLMINCIISFMEEKKAENAVATLMASIAPKTKVLRDGEWREVEATILVTGDIISIKLGDVIPADARLLEGDPIKMDQSALTGESLPVTKNPGDVVFLGSICEQGQIEAVVVATSVHTSFGKATYLVDRENPVGHFQKVLTSIGNFCICFNLVGMLIEILVMYPILHRKYKDGLDSLLEESPLLCLLCCLLRWPLVLTSSLNKVLSLSECLLLENWNFIEVFTMGMEKENVDFLTARASKTRNLDAIDAAIIVGMLTDPKEA